MITLNIAFNIILVGISSIKDIAGSSKYLFIKIKKWQTERDAQKVSELLVGAKPIEKMMNKYKHDLEEKKAIEFCKEFQKERKWCYENGLDYRSLQEEKTFQNHLKKFKFKSKK